jgi:hypothetical protein
MQEMYLVGTSDAGLSSILLENRQLSSVALLGIYMPNTIYFCLLYILVLYLAEALFIF